MLKVAVFDDVIAARRESFRIPGLDVDVYGHADDADVVCNAHDYDVVLMDFSMGRGHKTGADAITSMRRLRSPFGARCRQRSPSVSARPPHPQTHVQKRLPCQRTLMGMTRSVITIPPAT